MQKARDLRKLNHNKLTKLLNDIEYQQILASSQWSKNLVDKNKAGLKGTANRGEKTSMQKDLRRLRAKILTILNERGLKK